MSSNDSEEKYQLTIRCAMQSFSDCNVECPSNWSVLQLKQLLFQKCDSKPDPARQRLIYAGRCLDNEQSMRDVLTLRRDGIIRNETPSEKQVIHMVYIGAKNETSQSNSSKMSEPFTAEGLRRRGVNDTRQQTPANVYHLQNQAFPIPQPQQQYFYNYPTNNPHQQQNYEAWLTAYQTYMSQMAQFYHQMPYAQTIHPTGNQMIGFVNVPPTNAGGPQFGHQPAAFQFNGQHPQQLELQQQQQRIAVAEAGVAAAVQADFLDVLYKSIRFALLAMILYLYSSLERFFCVLAIVALFWFVHRRRNQQQQNNNQENIHPQEDQVVLPDGQRDEIEQNNDAQIQLPDRNSALQPQQSSALNVFFTVVQSFFTSLVPNPVPAPIDLN